jgi:iron complex outermembrane receptor protein
VDLTPTGPTWFHAVQDNRVPTSNGVPGDYSKTRRDAFALLNLRLLAQRHHRALTFWVKNLANKRYLQEVITAPEGGAAFIHDSPRRGYGLDLSYAFGD